MTLVLGRYKTTILRQHVNKCLREFCGPLNAKSVLNLGAKPFKVWAPIIDIPPDVLPK